jgi:hypothetical protein
MIRRYDRLSHSQRIAHDAASTPLAASCALGLWTHPRTGPAAARMAMHGRTHAWNQEGRSTNPGSGGVSSEPGTQARRRPAHPTHHRGETP